MPTTIIDVAERASVSTSTAWWLLNGRDRVHADTVRRVQRATVEFGFRLNALARALVIWHSETTGLLIPKFNSLLLFEIARGLVDTILATNLGLLIAPQDIAIVDHGDILLARHITPLLTTVNQPTYELGIQATQFALTWSRR